MTEQTQYENKGWDKPKCNGCGEEIEFVQLRNFKGEVKAHPVNADKAYMIMSTGEKNEKGQYIFESKRIFVSHFKTCPAAIQKDKERAEAKATGGSLPESDKPPF